MWLLATPNTKVLATIAIDVPEATRRDGDLDAIQPRAPPRILEQVDKGPQLKYTIFRQ